VAYFLNILTSTRVDASNQFVDKSMVVVDQRFHNFFYTSF